MIQLLHYWWFWIAIVIAYPSLSIPAILFCVFCGQKIIKPLAKIMGCPWDGISAGSPCFPKLTQMDEGSMIATHVFWPVILILHTLYTLFIVIVFLVFSFVALIVEIFSFFGKVSKKICSCQIERNEKDCE